MRRPARRAVVFGITVAVALAGVTVAVTTRSESRSGVAALRLDDDAAATGTSAGPTATPTPSPTPTRTRATPTAKARPATTTAPETDPTATSTRSSGTYTDYGPRPPGSVTVPYRAGQTSWDVTADGIRIRVSMTPAKVGEPMTWTVNASSPDAACCSIYILYGDGYGTSNGVPCDDPDPSMAYRHTYNGSGRREFMVQVETERCQHGSQGVVYGAFDIAPGTPTAQGPALPTVKFDSSVPVKGHESDPRYVTLWGEAADEDGFITKLVVDFGDGTSRTFDPDNVPCQRSMDGWPTASQGSLPYDPPPYHVYKTPGTYRITLTGYSAGCDGSMVQTGRASFTWHVPEPEPTAEPTPTASPTTR